MSKNTRNTEFRKIDVDQYDEEKYKEEDQLENQSPSTGPNETELTTLIYLNISCNGRCIDALKLVLKSAPLGCKNQAVKDSALSLVLRVLMGIKASQMEEAVKSLDRDMIDTLMKYIYRGFEQTTEKNSGHLLTWHEKVFAVGGVGSIVRVLTDRKRV
ncbi:hypothetical protein CHUAL_009266 [Chamberlinius hualienensis]